MRKRAPFACFLILVFHGVIGLEVIIDYSFRLPEKFGAATPKSANCCKFGRLPENDTQGMVVPTVFGLGVQKGGTTTLYDHFQVHPRMIGAKKELHYLDTCSNESYTSYLKSWGRNRKGPRKLVNRNGTDVSVVIPPFKGLLYEISPSYMYVPFSACKAKVISPHAKFIVFLRDPTSRMYSGLSYTIQVMRNRPGDKRWMSRSFWSLAYQGIREVEQEPMCDFQTGKGEYDYNDCVGCMMRWVQAQKNCKARPFVTLTDDQGSYKCNFVGKEHVLRSMYGPQLAWWFTLHDPSQFKIINSDRFFQKPLEVMKEIGSFLGLKPAYTKWMMDKSKKKSNVGHYRKENPTTLAFAKEVLREFYRRPNLELYRLLHATGHHDFEPFEKDLQSVTLLNCSDQNTVSSGICGDPRFHKGHPAYGSLVRECPSSLSHRYDPDAGRLPAKVARAVHVVEEEDPEADSIAVLKETSGSSISIFESAHSDSRPKTHTEIDMDFGQPSSSSQETSSSADAVYFDADDQPAEETETLDDSTPVQGEQAEKDRAEQELSEEREKMPREQEVELESMEAIGTLPDNPSETSHEEELDQPSEVAKEGDRSSAEHHEEVTKTQDETRDPKFVSHNEAGIAVVTTDAAARDRGTYTAVAFRANAGTERRQAQKGMITADHFVHFVYGVVFTLLLFYGLRWANRRQRREQYSHV